MYTTYLHTVAWEMSPHTKTYYSPIYTRTYVQLGYTQLACKTLVHLSSMHLSNCHEVACNICMFSLQFYSHMLSPSTQSQCAPLTHGNGILIAFETFIWFCLHRAYTVWYSMQSSTSSVLCPVLNNVNISIFVSYNYKETMTRWYFDMFRKLYMNESGKFSISILDAHIPVHTGLQYHLFYYSYQFFWNQNFTTQQISAWTTCKEKMETNANT